MPLPCRLNAIALDRGGSRCLTAGQDRAARLWSLPAAAPGMSQSGGLMRQGTLPSAGLDAAGQGVIGSVALELELSGHGLSNLGTGAPRLFWGLRVFLCCAMGWLGLS